MDGLLGIGKAGGSSSVNEGALLASRLNEMRQERDARAKDMKVPGAQETQRAPVPMGGGAGELTFEEMDAPPQVEGEATAAAAGGGNSRPRRSRNKKKKKKKGRR